MADLVSLIPRIKRARDFRLYDFSGRRYIDCYRSDGALLLGHKPQGLVTLIKQVAEKGLLADLPSIYSKRLMNALRLTFPAYQTFLVATSLEDIVSWAADYLRRAIMPTDIKDPLSVKSGVQGDIFLWRPFLTGNVESEIVVPVLPVGIAGPLYAFCSKKPFTPLTSKTQPVSAVVLAAAAHCLHLMKRVLLPGWYTPALLKDAVHFLQKDIYLIPRCSAETYESVFRWFLESGILLSPHYPRPSILPLELSDGELHKLALLFNTDGQGAPHG